MPIQQMLLGVGKLPDEEPGQQVFLFTGTKSTTAQQTTHTFTPGVGVTRISILAIGGGGGGYSTNGGGGGGTAIRDNVAVTPGTAYTVYVGGGGAGASTGTSAGAGGDSYITTDGNVLTKGEGGAAAFFGAE